MNVSPSFFHSGSKCVVSGGEVALVGFLEFHLEGVEELRAFTLPEGRAPYSTISSGVSEERRTGCPARPKVFCPQQRTRPEARRAQTVRVCLRW